MPASYGYYPLGEPFQLVFLFTSSIEYNAVDVDDQDKNHPMTTLMMDYIQYPHISGHDKIDPVHVMAWVYQHKEPFFPDGYVILVMESTEKRQRGYLIMGV